MNLQELYNWIFHQNPDFSGLSLKATGIVLGLVLALSHLFAWLNAEASIAIARRFPRNRTWGIVILGICLVWSLFLAAYMDMGEFFTFRRYLLMILPVTFALVIMYVPEFLAVRALGTLMLLAASPVLHAAFLQPQISRLLLPILAYVWIIVGMFFVGMPYLMRDWVTWATKTAGRWKLASLAGAAYGIVLLVVALVNY
ncbi:hypothetical protein [Verrucomicrobium sp. BvORR106]|uniref:hypothetical protein n=1 Tax=Verrucomicrobium sp. BvORR106 TaxID=1403819 RepID=UPI00068928B0|nr:hypothetical protein [Verrucomicrobium sp. BvORR106]